VWTPLQNGRGVEAMLAKFVLYNSEHTPGRDLLSTLSAAAILQCVRSLRYSVRRPTSRRLCCCHSTLRFCLKGYCTLSKLSAAVILHCERSLRYSVRRPTSRRPCCCHSTLRTLSTSLCETTRTLCAAFSNTARGK